MRGMILTLTLPLCLVSVPAMAVGPIAFDNGVVRIANGAAEAKNRSFWVRGQSLVLVLPGGGGPSQIIKTVDPLIREVRLSSKGNRTELEVRLTDRAENQIPHLMIQTDKRDLLLYFSEAAGTPKLSKVAVANSAESAQATAARISSTGEVAKPEPNTHQVTGNNENSAQAASLGLWPKQDRLNPLNQKSSSTGTTLWMVVMGAFMAGGVVWWKRQRKRTVMPPNAHIEVISSRALSTKHKLVMVDAGGELLLLGCTDKDVRLLRTLKRKQMVMHAESPVDVHEPIIEATLEKRIERELPAAGERMTPKIKTKTQSKPENPRLGTETTEALRFVQKLSQHIQQRHTPALPPVEEDAAQPLDERWAENIIKLRRAIRDTPPSSTETLH